MPSHLQPDFGPTTQQFDEALSHEALPTGSRVGGYQIVEMLGGGGFGIVYLALDLSLQRKVAIKEYLPTDMAQRGANLQIVTRQGASKHLYGVGLDAFLQEAKQLARFDHPSLVRVYSFWKENGTAYMVMPFYSGHTLRAELRSIRRAPDEAWLRALLTPLLGVLGMLHTAGVYHRDISPQNILIMPDGRPVLLDFGAAGLAVRDQTIPLAAMLNPSFAPIEQYTDSSPLLQGPWTDLYALASVVYLAIVGKPPMSATVRAIEDRQPPLAETVRQLQRAMPSLSYSASFLATIDKALSVHPKDRLQNAADFQASLDGSMEQAAPPEEPEDDVSTAIAAALRSLPSQPRAEPAFRMPDFQQSKFGDVPSSPLPLTRSRPSLRKRLLPWGLVLFAGAGLAAGGWQWSRTPQASRALVALGVVAKPASLPLPEAAAAVPEPTRAAEPASAPVVLSDDEATALVARAASEPAVAADLPASSASVAVPPAPAAETAAQKEAVAIAAAPPSQASAAAIAKTAEAVEVEALTPRSACGARTNFALYYCMQTQCKRPKFAQNVQCYELQQRGEVSN